MDVPGTAATFAHVKHITFDPRSADTIYASVEVGAGLKSTDGGRSWRQMTGFFEDVHRMVVTAARPDDIFHGQRDRDLSQCGCGRHVGAAHRSLRAHRLPGRRDRRSPESGHGLHRRRDLRPRRLAADEDGGRAHRAQP